MSLIGHLFWIVLGGILISIEEASAEISSMRTHHSYERNAKHFHQSLYSPPNISYSYLSL
ncbi:MAG: hypothetical protein EHM72_08080 [Calditrichaeota bacterium]|nr:MAG: hypothetical protein EHM72_08080 [Calditrichota bacterium]